MKLSHFHINIAITMVLVMQLFLGETIFSEDLLVFCLLEYI